MTTDERIDQILVIVKSLQEQGRQNEIRFERSEMWSDNFESRFARLESRHDELFCMMREHQKVNEARFNQLTVGLESVRAEVGGVKVEITKLDSKIDRVHESLSQDLHAFVGDLHRLERRVAKKRLS